MQLDNFVHAPSHALMIVGPSGSGKKTVAHKLGADVLGQNPALTGPATDGGMSV